MNLKSTLFFIILIKTVISFRTQKYEVDVPERLSGTTFKNVNVSLSHNGNLESSNNNDNVSKNGHFDRSEKKNEDSRLRVRDNDTHSHITSTNEPQSKQIRNTHHNRNSSLPQNNRSKGKQRENNVSPRPQERYHAKNSTGKAKPNAAANKNSQSSMNGRGIEKTVHREVTSQYDKGTESSNNDTNITRYLNSSQTTSTIINDYRERQSKHTILDSNKDKEEIPKDINEKNSKGWKSSKNSTEVNPKLGREDGDDSAWVWPDSDGSVMETTTKATTVALEDRAAFSANKCPSGRVRILEQCVEPD